jgi:multidrug efflux pump subunit AcrA (membrane-fusion protein)
MNGEYQSGTAGRKRDSSPARIVRGFLLSTVLASAVVAPPAAFAADGGIKADVSTCLLRPRHLVQLGSSVFGVLAKVFVDRSAVVTEGQPLAKLDTTVEETQLALDRFHATNTAQIDADKVDLAWNQRELARRQQLAGNMFSKANDIDEYVTKVDQDRIAIRKAEADLQTSKMEADRSEAQLNLKILKSPVNGVVTDVKLAPGEFIYETTPIMTIAQVDPLIVDLVVQADRYRAVKVGMIGEVHLNPPMDETFPCPGRCHRSDYRRRQQYVPGAAAAAEPRQRDPRRRSLFGRAA